MAAKKSKAQKAQAKAQHETNTNINTNTKQLQLQLQQWELLHKHETDHDALVGTMAKLTIEDEFNIYFGENHGKLDNWRRLCGDLGQPADLPSITKCRKAIQSVHVNIRQFLKAERKPDDVVFFKSVWKLAAWSRKKGRRVAIDEVPRASPMRALMRELSRY